MDILKFSRPARITSPLSLHQCCANEWLRLDLLEKAYNIKNNPVERMKYVFSFIIGGIHQGPEVCRSYAPFNPIIGETFQASLPIGANIYFEQTEHHPPSFNYFLSGPNNHYEMSGFGTIVANLQSINIIKGERQGKNIIRFDDGTVYSFTNFKTRLNGMVMGTRTYNYYGDLIVKDYKNKIECIYTLNDEDNFGMFSSMFFGGKKTNFDEGKVEIKQINPKTKEKEIKAKGYASWLGQLYFGDKEYWSIFDPLPKWEQKNCGFVLESDSTKREDLIAVSQNDFDKAQEHKDRIENLQRHDAKLRDENSK